MIGQPVPYSPLIGQQVKGGTGTVNITVQYTGTVAGGCRVRAGYLPTLPGQRLSERVETKENKKEGETGYGIRIIDVSYLS